MFEEIVAEIAHKHTPTNNAKKVKNTIMVLHCMSCKQLLLVWSQKMAVKRKKKKCSKSKTKVFPYAKIDLRLVLFIMWHSISDTFQNDQYW